MKFFSIVAISFLTCCPVASADELADSWEQVSANALKEVLQPNLSAVREGTVGLGSDLAGYLNTATLNVQKGMPPEEPYFLVTVTKAEPNPGDLTDDEILKRTRTFIENSISEEDNSFFFSLTPRLQEDLFTTVNGIRTLNPTCIRVAFSNTEPENHPPIITPVAGQTTSQGETGVLQIRAHDPDGDEPLIYSARGLPTGMSMDADGRISGTIASAGTFDVVVTVSDQKPNGTANMQFQWVVIPLRGYDPFDEPQGLSMPVDELLACLGYNTNHRLNGVPFPYTTRMCITLAQLCYHRGLYVDARAIAAHGLRSSRNASLVYIRGAAELGMGDRHSSLQTIKELVEIAPREPVQNLSTISGPTLVRFLIAYRAVRNTPDNTDMAIPTPITQR